MAVTVFDETYESFSALGKAYGLPKPTPGAVFMRRRGNGGGKNGGLPQPLPNNYAKENKNDIQN